MLSCLAPLAHRLWVCIETLLHDFEHVLMLPSGNAPQGCWRALRFERAGRTGRCPVMTKHLAVFLPSEPISQLLARRTAVDILRGQIDKVLLAEAPICLRAPGSSASAASLRCQLARMPESRGC